MCEGRSSLALIVPRIHPFLFDVQYILLQFLLFVAFLIAVLIHCRGSQNKNFAEVSGKFIFWFVNLVEDSYS